MIGIRCQLSISLLMLLAFGLGFSSCESKDGSQSKAAGSQNLSKDELILVGKRIYQANCISCHDMDPKKAGPFAPPVWGSSQELITERVLNAAYPQGYKPQRTTRIMVALPHLKEQIPAIHQYLNTESQ